MRHLSAVVGLLFGFTVVGSAQEAQSYTYSEWIAACLIDAKSCVNVCQSTDPGSGPKFCAEQINGYLTEKPGGERGELRYESWKDYPGRLPIIRVNNSTPMHGTYLRMYVNKIAGGYIRDYLQNNPGSVQTVNFPNGSIIVKLNSINSTMLDPQGPWLTAMFKIKGYCHGKANGKGNCVGGDWFYYLHHGKNFGYFDKVPAYGKAKAFCSWPWAATRTWAASCRTG